MSTSKATHIILKVLKWTAISVAALVVLIPVLLYIPFIQDFVVGIAEKKIEQSTGMDVSIERLRLKFPLRVELRGLVMSEKGDTMLAARSADLDVAFWPLLKSEIDVTEAELTDAFYRLNNADSAVYLKARIDRFRTAGTNLTFNIENISVGKTLLDGADIDIVLKDTTTVSPTDTTVTRMLINAPDLTLRNVSVRMRMLPTIDSLYARIGNAHLTDGRLDLAAQTIDVKALDVDSVTAAYIMPSEQFLAGYHSPPVSPADSALLAEQAALPSKPWQIRAGRIAINGKRALYATRGSRPAAGFDPEYIEATGIKIAIDSFYNCGTTLRVPIRHIAAKERCGVSLDASGVFDMDSTTMRAGGFNISTQWSEMKLDALMGLGDLMTDPTVPLRLDADGFISLRDVYAALPAVAAMMKGIPASSQINVDADIRGTSGRLGINRMMVNMPGSFSLDADGMVADAFDFNRMNGRINIDGDIRDVSFIKDRILDKATARTIGIPPMTVGGTIDYSPGLIDGNLSIASAGGKMSLDAGWNQKAEGYDLSIDATRFPLQKFLPGMGIADLTATANMKGHGYDPSRRTTSATADIDLRHVAVNGRQLENISLTASLDTCRAVARINSLNADADFDADLTAWVTADGYDWDLSGDIRHLDLRALGFSDDTMNGSTDLYTSGHYNPRNGDTDAELSITRLTWNAGTDIISVPDATAKFYTTDTLTRADIDAGDFRASATALCGLDTLMARLSATGDEIMRQTADMNFDVPLLQRTLPQLSAEITSGRNNPVASYLQETSDITFSDASLKFSNDSVITAQAAVNGFTTGSTRLDAIRFDARQHDRFFVYKFNIDNQPGTLDDFAHVQLNGYLAADKTAVLFKQADIKKRQGFFFGATATMTDSTVTVKLVPTRPTIAYKQWTINNDNTVRYDFVHRHLDANLKLSSDSSAVRLFTEHRSDTLATGQEDVVVQLQNISLAEWLSISPFAPPVKGSLDADLHFRWDEEQITGNGNVDLTDLYYGRDRVGTFRLDLDVSNQSHTKALRANVGLVVDGVKVITATGNLNDSTAVHPFLLDFSMIHFPLRVVNPFLPKDVAQMSGMLNGKMDITGDLANPIFNGYLDFDSTAVKLGITGTSYAFSEEKIPVDSNVVRFNDFTIAGLNKNPLRVNGTVDARRLSDIRLELALNASDMQIVNTNRPRGANVYGKAFIDLDATVKGTLSLLRVNADLGLLAGTNVTYVMTDGIETIVPQSADGMVKFVQFADTAAVAKADSVVAPTTSVILDARLAIESGSTLNVDLSPDGKNKVSVSGSGNFTYSLTPMSSDGRLTGRYTIDSGFARYTPQISTGGLSMAIMSEKDFKFTEGSYIAFNGDMLNPTLNIRAVDRLKANVTQSGQNSRLVNFDVTLSVTNTLQNMNVAFDLSTDDDLTISNELQSMSADQRANQAMNMLLYNQYTGPGTKANANLSGNPLYAFLASQLNSWAANNIRGVDISFGIDQYDTTTDGAKSTTTSYSYRVSKTLFNDRFKIIVGGNYSTDADADENFSQNLINDISFEYMLNRSGSMYVRLFRHVGYESILEGEITQTGVGFVLKRKLNSLRDIFRFGPRKKPSADTEAEPSSPQEKQ